MSLTWTWKTLTGLMLLGASGQLMAAESSVSDYSGNYYYVKEGDGCRRVEGDPSKVKPDYWCAYFYNRSAVADGSKKGRWGSESQPTVAELVASVKKLQEAELRDTHPFKTITWLNVFYPVARFYRDWGATNDNKEDEATGSTENKAKETSKLLDAGDLNLTVPWPNERKRYQWVLTTAENYRIALELVRQIYTGASPANNPFRNVGMVVRDFLDTTQFALDRADDARRQIQEGVTPVQEEFISTLDQIAKGFEESQVSYDSLRNAVPEVFESNRLPSHLDDNTKTNGTAVSFPPSKAPNPFERGNLTVKPSGPGTDTVPDGATTSAKPNLLVGGSASGDLPALSAHGGSAKQPKPNPLERAARTSPFTPETPDNPVVANGSNNPFERRLSENPLEQSVRLKKEREESERRMREAAENVKREQERMREIAQAQREAEARREREAQAASEREEAERKQEMAEQREQRRLENESAEREESRQSNLNALAAGISVFGNALNGSSGRSVIPMDRGGTGLSEGAARLARDIERNSRSDSDSGRSRRSTGERNTSESRETQRSGPQFEAKSDCLSGNGNLAAIGKEAFEKKSIEGFPDKQLAGYCATAWTYYDGYLKAREQGYSESDANRTYEYHRAAAETAIQYYNKTKR